MSARGPDWVGEGDSSSCAREGGRGGGGGGGGGGESRRLSEGDSRRSSGRARIRRGRMGATSGTGCGDVATSNDASDSAGERIANLVKPSRLPAWLAPGSRHRSWRQQQQQQEEEGASLRHTLLLLPDVSRRQRGEQGEWVALGAS
ncbi:unnamed protein product [Lampetra fluviatilis]